MGYLKTPCRWPGGKSRVAGLLVDSFPPCTEYIEPMVGGGSVFIQFIQRYPGIPVTISDLNPDLMAFWITLRDSGDNLCSLLEDMEERTRGDLEARTALYQKYKAATPASPFGRAVRFYLLNCMSFSGTTEAGGFSRSAALDRFTPGKIRNLWRLVPLLKDVQMHCDHWQDLAAFFIGRPDVLVFLDPPYVSASKLYGKNGSLHAFDHEALAVYLEHVWEGRAVLTYDDTPYVRSLYEHIADITTFEIRYGMDAGKRLAQELLIAI